MTPKNRNGADSGLEPSPKKSVSDKSNNTGFSGDCQEKNLKNLDFNNTGTAPQSVLSESEKYKILKERLPDYSNYVQFKKIGSEMHGACPFNDCNSVDDAFWETVNGGFS